MHIRNMLTGLLQVAALAATLYLAACLLLFWRHDNLIFFRVQNDAGLRSRHQQSHVAIDSHGYVLDGWWMRDPDEARPLILYFGGNADDVLYSADNLRALNLGSVLAFNYRGYGRSTGEPSQAALYEDALRIYDYAIEHGASPKQIVLVGRSLGSGVATMLAANRSVAAVVLITPFDSLAAVAAGHYPFFPVRLILRHPFPSDEWATNARAPVLIIAAELDQIVPPSHAHRLFDQWTGPKQFHLLEGVGHNDVERNRNYYPLMGAFIAERTR
jgi:pimeloyl-ACP methyl ester carboxylesterase